MARKPRLKGLIRRNKTAKDHSPGGIKRNYGAYNTALKVEWFDVIVDSKKNVNDNAKVQFKFHVKSEGNNPTTDTDLIGKLTGSEVSDLRAGFWTCYVRFEKQKIRVEPPREGEDGLWMPIPKPKNKKGDEYTITYLKIPRMQDTNVHLKCTCPDFRHVGEYGFYKAGLLAGGPRRYKRKTLKPTNSTVVKNALPGQEDYLKAGKFTERGIRYSDKEGNVKTARAHRNPGDVPILCKHLYNVLMQMQKEKMITGAVGL